jgi:ssDNA-binding Zn-finger/Zn-ribbon topoisomerase 1
MRDRGEFLGCTSYPKCKATVDKRALAAAKRVEGLTTKPCPKCQKPMLPRQTGKAPFWACSGYPECKGTAPIRPIRAEKPARASASGSGKAVA